MHSLKKQQNIRGFTLTEIMVALIVLSTVIAGASITFVMGLRAYHSTAGESDAASEAGTAIARMAYGLGNGCGLRAAFSPVSALSNNNGWSIAFSVPKGLSGDDTQIGRIRYDKAKRIIQFQPGAGEPWTTIGKNIVDSAIQTGHGNIRIMVKAAAIVGDTQITNTKITAIAFRN